MTLDEAIEVLCRTHLQDVCFADGQMDFEIMMGVSPQPFDRDYYVAAWQTLWQHRQERRNALEAGRRESQDEGGKKR